MRLLRITPLALLIALVASPAHAWMGPVMCGGGVAAVAGGCSASSNEINSARDTVQGTTGDVPSGYLWLFRAQADCSGNLNTAYIYHSDTYNSGDAKICVYTSDNADFASDTARSLVGCTSAIASGITQGWKSGSVTGSVTSGSYYWVLVAREDYQSAWKTAFATTATLWYKIDTGGAIYDSPPSTLSNSDWSTASLAPLSVYVTIGD